MRTSVIINLKGGVGKTSTVIHMAHILHRDFGSRVLVVDCDPSCNLTQFFAVDAETGSTSEVLRMGWHDGVSSGFIRKTDMDGVDILPASDTLMELDLSQLKTDRVKIYAFRMMVLELASLERYDCVLFDSPPAFNAACASALMAADDVIIPIKLDMFSVKGMANIMRQVKNMQRINSRLRVAGVLPTMWYRSDEIAMSERILRDSGFHVFPRIRYNRRMDKVIMDGETSNPRTGNMKDYKRFVAAYVKQGGVQHGKD